MYFVNLKQAITKNFPLCGMSNEQGQLKFERIHICERDCTDVQYTDIPTTIRQKLN